MVIMSIMQRLDQSETEQLTHLMLKTERTREIAHILSDDGSFKTGCEQKQKGAAPSKPDGHFFRIAILLLSVPSSLFVVVTGDSKLETVSCRYKADVRNASRYERPRSRHRKARRWQSSERSSPSPPRTERGHSKLYATASGNWQNIGLNRNIFPFLFGRFPLSPPPPLFLLFPPTFLFLPCD